MCCSSFQRTTTYLLKKVYHRKNEKSENRYQLVVEAVCDTKKNTNYIVTEYLSKNGVDTKEITKALRPSMDAVTDPRDTSETLADLSSATSNITPGGEKVKGEGAESYADVTLKADAGQTLSYSQVMEKNAAAEQQLKDLRDIYFANIEEVLCQCCATESTPGQKGTRAR